MNATIVVDAPSAVSAAVGPINRSAAITGVMPPASVRHSCNQMVTAAQIPAPYEMNRVDAVANHVSHASRVNHGRRAINNVINRVVKGNSHDGHGRNRRNAQSSNRWKPLAELRLNPVS